MLDTRREDFLITKKNVKSQYGKNKTENGAPVRWYYKVLYYVYVIKEGRNDETMKSRAERMSIRIGGEYER
jgi:hypothetical protein